MLITMVHALAQATIDKLCVTYGTFISTNENGRRNADFYGIISNLSFRNVIELNLAAS